MRLELNKNTKDKRKSQVNIQEVHIRLSTKAVTEFTDPAQV